MYELAPVERQFMRPEDGSGDWYYFDPTTGGAYEGACWRSRDNGAMEIWFVDQADSI